MFLPPPAPRSRPHFVLSLAAHTALVIALAVPPLLATQEPPEPDGTVHIDWIPVLTIDAPAGERKSLLKKGNQGGDAHPPATRASGATANPRSVLEDPRTIPDVLPPPTGEQSELHRRAWENGPSPSI